MKPVKYLAIIAAVALALGAVVGYLTGSKAGRSEGYTRAVGLLRKSTFISSFGALESLRAGEITNAIERLEATCYANAVALLEERDAGENPMIPTFKDSLLEYRRAYANPPEKQSPTEARLDELLERNRRPRETATD